MDIFEVFSTREIASIIYLSLLVMLALIKSGNWGSIKNLIKATFNKTLISPVLCLLAYAGLIIIGLQRLSWWDWLLIKDVIIWVFAVATPICFKAITNRTKQPYPFKKMVLDNFAGSALMEFFIGAFTFSFLAELIVVPLLSFFVILQNHDRKNENFKEAHKLLDVTSGIAGLVLIGFTVNKAVEVISQDGIEAVLISFCIPVIFSIAFMPVIYGLAIGGKYHDIYVRVLDENGDTHEEMALKKRKIFQACGISYRALCKFEQAYFAYIRRGRSRCDNNTFLLFIEDFKNGIVIEQA